jgi:hypothetical protein
MRSTRVWTLRGIGNVDRSTVGRNGVCLQVATDRAASKHLGHSRNLGKAGQRADPV